MRRKLLSALLIAICAMGWMSLAAAQGTPGNCYYPERWGLQVNNYNTYVDADYEYNYYTYNYYNYPGYNQNYQRIYRDTYNRVYPETFQDSFEYWYPVYLDAALNGRPVPDDTHRHH